MASFFEKSTTGGEYTVTGISRNDFEDGKLRIQPPTIFSESYLKELELEFGVRLVSEIVGKEATLLGLSTGDEVEYDDQSKIAGKESPVHALMPQEELSRQERVEYTVDAMLYDLETLVDIDTYTQTQEIPRRG